MQQETGRFSCFAAFLLRFLRCDAAAAVGSGGLVSDICIQGRRVLCDSVIHMGILTDKVNGKGAGGYPVPHGANPQR